MNNKHIGVLLSVILLVVVIPVLLTISLRGSNRRDNSKSEPDAVSLEANSNSENSNHQRESDNDRQREGGRDDRDGGDDRDGRDGRDDDGEEDGEQQGSGQPTNLAEAISFARQDIANIMNGNRAAKFLRLSFHDCVGGCDGCVDLSNPDNFGLDDPIENLQEIVDQYAGFLTRADVWVLAAMEAVEEQQDDGDVVQFDMQLVGRPNCDDNDPIGGPDRSIPSPHATTHELLDFFANTFGFTDRDTTAIMGAHTLGEASLQNSGFDGNNGWVRDEDEFDNEFYTTLLDNNQVEPDFELELQDNSNRPDFPSQFLWRLGNNRFMLNVDMALAVDFGGHIDPTSGEVSCNLPPANINACPMSSVLSIADEYADSNSIWLLDFRTAFYKMTSAGCGDGVCMAI